MGNINIGRVILGGVVAGFIVNLVEDVVNGAIIAQQWTDALKALGKPDLTGGQIVAFNVWGFLVGFVAVWTYAAMRPRFGAGPRTAVIAAVTIWLAAFVSVYYAWALLGLFPVGMMVLLTAVGLFEIVVATVAGAWLYKEA